jgi:hypothetical protein
MNPATPERKPTKPGPPPLSSRKTKLTISTDRLLFAEENTRHMEFTLEVGRLEMIGSYLEIIAIHHSDATKSMLPRFKGISFNGVITSMRGSSKGP